MLRIAKSLCRKESPNVVLPESAHFSFKKAGDMLGLEIRPVRLDGQKRMDVEVVREAIDADTCCIVGIAGTTEYGMVDLMGKSFADRAKLLISIAHPDFRDKLTCDARQFGFLS